MLRRTDGEPHVSNTCLARGLLGSRDRLGVRIEPLNAGCQPREREREAAIAAAEGQDAPPAHERLAAPPAELDQPVRPQGRRARGDMPADRPDLSAAPAAGPA